MNDFKNLAETTPAWSKVLLAFADQVPEGVQINSFSADLTTKKITISGFAPTREQVIQLYNNINDDKNRFKDINYPLENVSKPANINFHFTFYIKDELLKL
jgi:Tfp pilus assembly protein PilN